MAQFQRSKCQAPIPWRWKENSEQRDSNNNKCDEMQPQCLSSASSQCRAPAPTLPLPTRRRRVWHAAPSRSRNNGWCTPAVATAAVAPEQQELPLWSTSAPQAPDADAWAQPQHDDEDLQQRGATAAAQPEDAVTLSNPERLAQLQAAARRDRSLMAQTVQWYPGHIARAERQLKEQLKMVDVVLEVRDARIPVATHHPQVAKWVGPKPRLLVMNRQDQVSPADKRAWAEHFRATGQRVYWTQGKLGDGIKALRAVLDQTSEEINVRRAKRGLQPRPVRACVIGFPNIGKSALINRLIGRRAVASAAKPGVTRALQWVRLSGTLDLLDAPGVIPASFDDQVAAQRLAVCNDIGEAAYEDAAVAAAFIVRCKLMPSALKLVEVLRERYRVDPEVGTAEDFVRGVADRTFLGDIEKAGARILKDYRNGYLGPFALELPTDVDDKRRREVEHAQETAALQEAARKSESGF